MGRPPHIRPLRRTLPHGAVALAVAALLAAPVAAQEGSQASPRELWRAYPLKPDQAKRGADVQLPPGSTASAAPRATGAADGNGDGGSATLPIVLGVGAAGLALGVAAGRRRRGAATAGAPAPAGAAPPPPPPAAVPAQSAPRPAPEPAPRPVASPAPAPAPEPAPAPRPFPVPAATTPPVAPAPAARRGPEPAPPPPSAAPSPPTRRFVREPWPADTEDRWRCEITWRDGFLNAGFRAMVMAPDGSRARELGRPSPEPPWDATPQERRTAVQQLVAALNAAGWQLVGSGGPWYAARFVWPQSEPPPRKLTAPSTPRGDRR
jgi:hypothetical protein